MLAPEAELARLLGCRTDELAPAIAGLGYRLEVSEAGTRIFAAPRACGPSRRDRHYLNGNWESHSPFAALEALRSAR